MKAMRELFGRKTSTAPTYTPVSDASETSAYECSITLDLAELPVYAMDGRLYGLEAIDTWVASKGTSPATRERIPRTYLRPAELVEGYTAYCTSRGIKVPSLPVGTIKRGTDAAPPRTAIVRAVLPPPSIDDIVRSLVGAVDNATLDRHLPAAAPRAAWPVIPPPPPPPPVYAPSAPVDLPKYARFLLRRREIDAKAAMAPDAYKKGLNDHLIYHNPAVVVCTDFPQPFMCFSKVARYMVDDVPRTFAERLRLLLPAERQLFLRTCVCYVILNKKKLEALPEFLPHVVRLSGGTFRYHNQEKYPFPLVFAEGRRTVRMTVGEYITLWAKSEPTHPLRTRLGHLGSDELLRIPYPDTDRDDLPRHVTKATHLEAAALYVLNRCPA